jgi:hypothetical protein
MDFSLMIHMLSSSFFVSLRQSTAGSRNWVDEGWLASRCGKREKPIIGPKVCAVNAGTVKHFRLKIDD